MSNSKTLRIGTNNFANGSFARRYYAHYGYENIRKALREKIEKGEIVIGPPDLNKYPNAVSSYADSEGRYHVVCEDKTNGN